LKLQAHSARLASSEVGTRRGAAVTFPVACSSIECASPLKWFDSEAKQPAQGSFATGADSECQCTSVWTAGHRDNLKQGSGPLKYLPGSSPGCMEPAAAALRRCDLMIAGAALRSLSSD
jgi:hypothetical protein